MIPLSRPLCAAALAAAAVLSLAACGGSKHPSTTPTTTPPPPSPSVTPTTSPVAAPAAKPKAPVNPFTGIGAIPKSPVIVVKIDDTAPGRPQVGIDKADIVYVEEVEGGLDRLAAVFGTKKPVVGYVRSTRPSDPDLLLQFGKITEAYSGGAHDSLPRVKASGITSWSNDAGARFYSRVNRSQSSYINLVLNLAKVAKAVKTPAPKSIGWTWNPSLSGLGAASIGTDVKTYVGRQLVEFRYNPKTKKYVRYIDGEKQLAADGKAIQTSNVIVQTCKVVSHPQDTDVDGNPSQFTYTVGSGPVSVFRDGKRVYGTWSRPRLTSGTALRTKAGKPLALQPGGAWVALVRRGVATTGSPNGAARPA